MVPFTLLAPLLALAPLLTAGTQKTNAMNNDASMGGLYKIANPPAGASPYVDASRHAHRGQYVEVYSQVRLVFVC